MTSYQHYNEMTLTKTMLFEDQFYLLPDGTAKLLSGVSVPVYTHTHNFPFPHILITTW